MKITFVHSVDGDWVGMYIDDKLVAENHSLRLSDVVEHIKQAEQLITSIEEIEVGEWLGDEGRLPATLSEVARKEKQI